MLYLNTQDKLQEQDLIWKYVYEDMDKGWDVKGGNQWFSRHS